jgi:cyclic pyranopterin phosphate synthase
MEKQKLSHTDERGKANMVDVSVKTPQVRTARASGKILLRKETIELIRDNQMKKGDVLTIAEIAGIQAAKQTSSLIPLTHPLQISKVQVKTSIAEDGVVVETLVKCIGPTGVEMEALTAVSVALLTVYDMCKAVDKEMVITDITLIEKTKQDVTV